MILIIPFGGLALFILCIVLSIAYISWTKQKEQIGTIRCNRCNNVGLPQGQLVPFRGIKPVCQKCQSEDWIIVEQLPDFCEIPPHKFKSNLASSVLQIHKANGPTYALLNMSKTPTHELLRNVDDAYDELERSGFIERAGGEIEPYPGGPMRPLRKITARGKGVNTRWSRGP